MSPSASAMCWNSTRPWRRGLLLTWIDSSFLCDLFSLRKLSTSTVSNRHSQLISLGLRVRKSQSSLSRPGKRKLFAAGLKKRWPKAHCRMTLWSGCRCLNCSNVSGMWSWSREGNTEVVIPGLAPAAPQPSGTPALIAKVSGCTATHCMALPSRS